MTEDDLYVAIMDVVNQAIGPQLSLYGVGAQPKKPAIFKKSPASQDGRKLHGILPYCVITMGVKTSQGARHHARWYRSSDGSKVTQIIRDVDCTVQVVGGSATDLVSTLENFFLVSEYATDYLCERNIVVKDSFGVIPQTTTLNNTSHDSAFVILSLTTTDEVVEEVYELNIVDTNLNLRYPDSEDNIVSENITIP